MLPLRVTLVVRVMLALRLTETFLLRIRPSLRDPNHPSHLGPSHPNLPTRIQIRRTQNRRTGNPKPNPKPGKPNPKPKPPNPSPKPNPTKAAVSTITAEPTVADPSRNTATRNRYP